MKNFIILAMLGMSLFSGIADATELKPLTPSPEGIWIKFSFCFHRPKFQCKSGFGVCADVTFGYDPDAIIKNNQNFCQVKAKLNERNQLIVEVTAEALASYENASILPYFKDKSSITILDPYTLSAPTCKALGSTTPLTINPGNYPVSFSNGVYTVTFQF